MKLLIFCYRWMAYCRLCWFFKTEKFHDTFHVVMSQDILICKGRRNAKWHDENSFVSWSHKSNRSTTHLCLHHMYACHFKSVPFARNVMIAWKKMCAIIRSNPLAAPWKQNHHYVVDFDPESLDNYSHHFHRTHNLCPVGTKWFHAKTTFPVCYVVLPSLHSSRSHMGLIPLLNADTNFKLHSNDTDCCLQWWISIALQCIIAHIPSIAIPTQ